MWAVECLWSINKLCRQGKKRQIEFWKIKMEAKPANSVYVEVETATDDITLPSLEQSLLSFEKLDRASPDLWPTQSDENITNPNELPIVPGVSEFATLQFSNQSTASWNTGITTEDMPFVTKLGALPTIGLIKEVKKLHDIAYQLGLEEAKEMTRGKYLNIFRSRKKTKC